MTRLPGRASQLTSSACPAAASDARRRTRRHTTAPPRRGSRAPHRPRPRTAARCDVPRADAVAGRDLAEQHGVHAVRVRDHELIRRQGRRRSSVPSALAVDAQPDPESARVDLVGVECPHRHPGLDQRDQQRVADRVCGAETARGQARHRHLLAGHPGRRPGRARSGDRTRGRHGESAGCASPRRWPRGSGWTAPAAGASLRRARPRRAATVSQRSVRPGNSACRRGSTKPSAAHELGLAAHQAARARSAASAPAPRAPRCSANGRRSGGRKRCRRDRPARRSGRPRRRTARRPRRPRRRPRGSSSGASGPAAAVASWLASDRDRGELDRPGGSCARDGLECVHLPLAVVRAGDEERRARAARACEQAHVQRPRIVAGRGCRAD